MKPPLAAGSAYRVLIVDDSMVVRSATRRILEAAPDILPVDVAANGQQAIKLVENHASKQTPIDIVLLDVEMPVMDGLSALPKLLKADPASMVIMSSTSTSRGAANSVKALALGASDYVCKPSSQNELNSGSFQEELIEKIRCWGNIARRQRKLISSHAQKNGSAAFSGTEPGRAERLARAEAARNRLAISKKPMLRLLERAV